MQKYMVVYSEIKTRIESGLYKEGALLPFEKELGEDFSASRGTIRKALDMLESKGMILKIKGKGSIVQKRNIIFSLNDIKSLKEQSMELSVPVRTEVLEMELLDDEELLSTLFPEAETSKIWKIKRLRYFDDIPSILDIDYLLQSRVENLSLKVLNASLYDYLEKDLLLYPKMARKIITIEEPEKDDELLIGDNTNQKIVVVSSNVYSSSNDHFQVSISRHRSDTFKFSCVSYR